MSEPPEEQDWWPTSSAAWRLKRGETPSWRLAIPQFAPYGLRIGADGIEVLYSGRNRRYGWADVGEVKRTRRGGLVPLGGTTVEITGYRGRVDAIVAEIERLRPPPPLAGFDVTAEQIARWLEIEPDGQFTVALPRWRGWGEVPWLASFCLFNAVVQVARGEPVVMAVVTCVSVLVVYFGLHALFAVERPTWLLVSPYGLRHGRRHIPWDEVVDVLPEQHGWRIRTQPRSFEMRNGPEAERVADTIRRICSARKSGALLPRMGAVPEGAISRAEGVEISAERGISPAEDGEP